MRSPEVCTRSFMMLCAVAALLIPGGQTTLPAHERPRVLSVSSADEAFRLALAHDVPHDHRGIAIELARGDLERLNRVRLPSLVTTVSRGWERVMYASDTQVVQLQAGLAYPVYDGGMRELSRRSAAAELAMAQTMRLDYEADLRNTVESLLASIEFATQAARIAEQYSARVGGELESLTRDHELGLLTDYEMGRVGLSVARTTIEARQREALLEDLLTDLRQILGVGNEVVLRVSSEAARPALSRAIRNDISTLTEFALREDLALQQQRLRLETARAALEFLPSTSLPVIRSTVGLSMTGTPLPLTSPEVSLGLSFSWPGINEGSLSLGGGFSADSARYTARSISLETGAWTRHESRNDATRRRMNVERAEFTYEAGRQQTEAWVRRTVRDFARLTSTIAADGEEVALAELALTRIRSDVAGGHSRGTAILDAERALAEARLAALENSFARARLYRRLQQRTGLDKP